MANRDLFESLRRSLFRVDVRIREPSPPSSGTRSIPPTHANGDSPLRNSLRKRGETFDESLHVCFRGRSWRWASPAPRFKRTPCSLTSRSTRDSTLAPGFRTITSSARSGTAGSEIEIGLGGLIRFGDTGNITPTPSTTPGVDGQFVNLPPGLSPVNQNSPPTLAMWNFNYSFYNAAGLAGDTAVLTITGLDGVPHVFPSGSLPVGPETTVQDSTNLGYFVGLGAPAFSYNPNQEGTYTITASLYDSSNNLLLSATAEYDVVPEPSTMVMGLMSSVLAGSYFWRKRGRHRKA